MPYFMITKKVTVEYETVVQADDIVAAQLKVHNHPDKVDWEEFKPSETWVVEELVNWEPLPEGDQ